MNTKLPLVLVFSFASVLTLQTHAHSQDGPVFTKEIENVTVAVGRDATLSCVITNLGNYKVAWVRVDTQTILTIDDVVITRNPRISVRHSSDSRLSSSSGHHVHHHNRRTWDLILKDVQTSDGGAYMCQLNTEPMTSQTAFLFVTVPPDITDSESSGDVMVTEGSNASLRCAATGHPQPLITWRREDNKPINSHAAATEGSVLHFTKVQRQHMGAYLCIASNGVPPSVSKRFMLRVQFSPSVSAMNQLIGAKLGDNVTLDCHCESFPRPVSYWLKHTTGEIVVPGSKYRFETAESNLYKHAMQLTIINLQVEDFMAYQCVCRNTMGLGDSVVRLYQIPTILKKLEPEVNDVTDAEYEPLEERTNTLTSENKVETGLQEFQKKPMKIAPNPKAVSNSGSSLPLSSLSLINYVILINLYCR